MDLSQIGAPSDTAKIELYHPTTNEPLMDKDGKAMFVEVYGQDSALYKKAAHEQQNRRIAKASRSGGRINMTSEQITVEAKELVVACVKAWNIEVGGEVPPCKEDKVREVFDAFPWVYDQVDIGMANRRNFMKN